MEYENVWPDVDLRYVVRGDGVKEDIRIRSARARSKFVFDIEGAKLAADEDGGLRIAGALGKRFRVPPPTVVAADGSDVTAKSRVRYGLRNTASGQRVAVVVDRRWLSAQPRSVFPLLVDPTFTDYAVSGSNVITINSSGATSATAPVRVGSEAGVHRRAAVRFPSYETYLNNDYRVYWASMGFTKQPPSYSAATTILGSFAFSAASVFAARPGDDRSHALTGLYLSGSGVAIATALKAARTSGTALALRFGGMVYAGAGIGLGVYSLIDSVRRKC